MIEEKPVYPDLDGLLERAFPDDLPADVAERMGRPLSLFRERWEKAERREVVPSRGARRFSTVFFKVSVAAAAILFIVIGLRLRASGPGADLGSSLASFQRAAFYSGRIADFQSMECQVRLDRPEESPQEFVIQWVSPEETRVRIIRAGEESRLTLHPPRPERSVLELISASGPSTSAVPPQVDAELHPVEGLLSSAQLQRLLDGRWQAAGTERRDGCDLQSFSVESAPDYRPSRITVDGCTSLPIRLEREVGPGARIEALFRWVPRSQPRGLLSPRPSPRGEAETTPS
jgi:hypothetical protein